MVVAVSAREVVCEAGALTHADLATVDALARLALDARRHGRGVRVRHAAPALRELLNLAALAEVVRGLVVEVSG